MTQLDLQVGRTLQRGHTRIYYSLWLCLQVRMDLYKASVIYWDLAYGAGMAVTSRSHRRVGLTCLPRYLLKTLILSTCLLQVITPGMGAEDGEGADRHSLDSTTLSTTGLNSNMNKNINDEHRLHFAPHPTTLGDTDIVIKTTAPNSHITIHSQSSTTKSTPTIQSTSQGNPITSSTQGQTLSSIAGNEPVTSASYTTQSQDTGNDINSTTKASILSGNETSNETYVRATNKRPFNLKSRLTYGLVAGSVALVLMVIGMLVCKGLEKRLVKSEDEEYAYILEDAFSMATEENLWDARWTTGKQQNSQKAAEEVDGRGFGEDACLRSIEHQRVTLHVPSNRPYGATESLIT